MTNATDRLAEDTKDVVRSEIAALRAKVEALMAERVTPALSDVAGQAEDLANAAATMARRQTDHLANTVRAQPFAAIGTAMIAGLAIGLLMRR
ncbi:hypothetical protein [Neoroseomonas lacus]|uniref:DUF883 domain-containing protein n=1 Tax=Neoroseomonas lacus TaxID=287609 RepID=A0A917NP09_9PROT|nr:hypothetical protein [Neoroseomonas lacus]GGJ14633.1 hypothetical protein GCM10011320_22360 [Neoroseomonas lacus]